MNFPETTPTIETNFGTREQFSKSADEFLGDAKIHLQPDTYEEIIQENIARTQETLERITTESPDKKIITHDKYKGFMVSGAPATMGQIVAARHLDKSIVVPAELDKSGMGKKLRKLVIEKTLQDDLYAELNHALARELTTSTQQKDLFKSHAYAKIAERYETPKFHEQLGVIAESVIQGFAEMIAIDRPDLGISVMPANAYQDVEEKVDFVITTTTKRRGAGVELVDPLIEEKHVGIQFTTNIAKEIFKKDQIEKAKERGTSLDDIVYVAVDAKTIALAITTWEKKHKPLSGVWGEFSKRTQLEIVKGLFHSLITEEQERSLLKSFE